MVIKSRGPGPPKSFGGWWLLTLTLLIFFFETASSEGNKIYDMQTLCEDRFRQALYRKIEGAYLKSQNERNLDCIVTFQTHSILQRFMLRFDLLQLDCNDHLFIYDGAHAVDSYKIMISEQGQRKSRFELQDLISSVNKTKPQNRVRRTPKFRFRAAIRAVLNNLKWLTEETPEADRVSLEHPQLTTQDKGWLRLPMEERSSEEKGLLLKIMGPLPCFDRYPVEMRESLTEAAMFVYYPPGRVLVAEGHPSAAMYFVLSGEATVSKLKFDPGFKKFISVDESVFEAGQAFGETNILHDEPWPTTVTTATHIEVLTVYKDNFKTIMEEFLGEQSRKITKCMNQFTYFKNWNTKTIVECCILARVVHYSIDSLIIGENCGDFENSYFIVSGCCRVIYHLQHEHIPRKFFTELRIAHSDIVTTQEDLFPASYTVKGLEMPKRKQIAEPFITGLIVDQLLTQIITSLPVSETHLNETGKSFVQKKVESHFCQVAELMPGACFGIGESLDKKFILSSTEEVVLLCIPKFFLKMHNLGNIWGRIRELYNHTYPSPQAISNRFKMDRKWAVSRLKYLNTLIKTERPFTGLTCAEAPYYTRLTTDFENSVFRRINTVVTKINKQPDSSDT